MDVLSDDVLLQILSMSYDSVDTLYNIATISKRFHQICKHVSTLHYTRFISTAEMFWFGVSSFPYLESLIITKGRLSKVPKGVSFPRLNNLKLLKHVSYENLDSIIGACPSLRKLTVHGNNLDLCDASYQKLVDVSIRCSQLQTGNFRDLKRCKLYSAGIISNVMESLNKSCKNLTDLDITLARDEELIVEISTLVNLSVWGEDITLILKGCNQLKQIDSYVKAFNCHLTSFNNLRTCKLDCVNIPSNVLELLNKSYKNLTDLTIKLNEEGHNKDLVIEINTLVNLQIQGTVSENVILKRCGHLKQVILVKIATFNCYICDLEQVKTLELWMVKHMIATELTELLNKCIHLERLVLKLYKIQSPLIIEGSTLQYLHTWSIPQVEILKTDNLEKLILRGVARCKFPGGVYKIILFDNASNGELVLDSPINEVTNLNLDFRDGHCSLNRLEKLFFMIKHVEYLEMYADNESLQVLSKALYTISQTCVRRIKICLMFIDVEQVKHGTKFIHECLRTLPWLMSLVVVIFKGKEGIEVEEVQLEMRNIINLEYTMSISGNKLIWSRNTSNTF